MLSRAVSRQSSAIFNRIPSKLIHSQARPTPVNGKFKSINYLLQKPTSLTSNLSRYFSSAVPEGFELPIPTYIDFDKSDIYTTLESRGFISASTSSAPEYLASGKRVVYAGFDPTSDNLHLGNLLVILALMHFQKHGHQVVVLVGGATGLIGDPSGRTSERTLLDEATVEKNVAGIQSTLRQFLPDSDVKSTVGPTPIMVNNFDWYSSMSVVSYLRDVGKYFRMGSMLGKDSVKKRMSSEDGGDADGMSFTEFSYQTLQGYDFYKLYENHGCTVQLGGSDQWGNITAGIDYINRYLSSTGKSGVEAHGLTLPLLTTSSGAKFGKSAGNALYLSPAKTSPYQLYQYLLQTPDSDVRKLLSLFTFFSSSYIDAIMQVHEGQKERRIAQRLLAEEVVRMIHGDIGVSKALQAGRILFGDKAPVALTLSADLSNEAHSLSGRDFVMALDGVPSKELPRDQVIDAEIVDLVVAVGLAASRGEARRLIKAGGLYVNNKRITDMEAKLSVDEHVVLDQVVLIRSGQKKQYFINMV